MKIEVNAKQLESVMKIARKMNAQTVWVKPSTDTLIEIVAVGAPHVSMFVATIDAWVHDFAESRVSIDEQWLYNSVKTSKGSGDMATIESKTVKNEKDEEVVAVKFSMGGWDFTSEEFDSFSPKFPNIQDPDIAIAGNAKAFKTALKPFTGETRFLVSPGELILTIANDENNTIRGRFDTSELLCPFNEIKGNGTTVYDMEYLRRELINTLPAKSGVVMQFSTDWPARVIVRTPEGANIEYLVAPWLESE